jgi:anti-sigma B factor antagonist
VPKVRSFYVLDEEIISDATVDPIHVIAAGGEIDYAACPQLRALLNDALESACAAVLVDLTGATFIDSTAIGALLAAASKLDDLGRRLVIACAGQQILEIFQIVGLDEIVSIHDSREQAVESVTSIA